jgi:hypothetical protein
MLATSFSRRLYDLEGNSTDFLIVSMELPGIASLSKDETWKPKCQDCIQRRPWRQSRRPPNLNRTFHLDLLRRLAKTYQLTILSHERGFEWDLTIRLIPGDPELNCEGDVYRGARNHPRPAPSENV